MTDQPITAEERARRRKEFVDRWKRPVEVALDGRSDITIDLREVEFESAADVIEWVHERGFQEGQNALCGAICDSSK